MNRHSLIILVIVAIVFGIAGMDVEAQSPDGNWPQFRGPNSSGAAVNARLPETWSTKENVLWKTAILGKGWSSPIVWGDRVFVTTVEWARKRERRHARVFTCREVWNHTAGDASLVGFVP